MKVCHTNKSVRPSVLISNEEKFLLRLMSSSQHFTGYEYWDFTSDLVYRFTPISIVAGILA